MRIYAPDGVVGRQPLSLAAAPTVLTGLRIGVLDNGKPNAHRLLTRAAERVAARTGAAVTVVTGKGPERNAATAAADDVLTALARDVDVVLTGSAD
ncbi:MAG TPA: hypothetical protein VFC33_09355 [Acidimicrobiia bacterium]|nr:hypothetical protein [Acidimicrobiia bacterium]